MGDGWHTNLYQIVNERRTNIKLKGGGGNNSICFNLICLSLQIPDIQQILLSSVFLKFQLGMKDEKQGLIEMFEMFHDF